MNPYIAAGFLIAGLFIGGLVTAWFFLIKCIMSGGITVEEKTCETCKFENTEGLQEPCRSCGYELEPYGWKPKE